MGRKDGWMEGLEFCVFNNDISLFLFYSLVVLR